MYDGEGVKTGREQPLILTPSDIAVLTDSERDPTSESSTSSQPNHRDLIFESKPLCLRVTDIQILPFNETDPESNIAAIIPVTYAVT